MIDEPIRRNIAAPTQEASGGNDGNINNRGVVVCGSFSFFFLGNADHESWLIFNLRLCGFTCAKLRLRDLHFLGGLHQQRSTEDEVAP